MNKGENITLRPAQPGDGQAVFEITRLSVRGLAATHYTPRQISGWMGMRTPAFYEDIIAQGNMVIAEHQGKILGFVDAVPGEVTRLFILPQAAGRGLGRRLLETGLEIARKGHDGPIRVESTRNAEAFYRRHGFKVIGTGYFSHGLGGDPIEIVQMER